MGTVQGQGLELLSPGTPAPRFNIDRGAQHRFQFDKLGGRYVVLAFLGRAGDAAGEAAFTAARDNLALFDGENMVLYWVNPDPSLDESGLLRPDGAKVGVLSDFNCEIARLFTLAGDGGVRPAWVVLDPRLRVLKSAPLSETRAVFDFLTALAPPPEQPAPVLTVPRVFEPEFCERLIAYHQSSQGYDSGFMQDSSGREQHVVDHDLKRRTDVLIEDQGLADEARSRICARLLPEIALAFAFEVTRMELSLIACYDGETGGFFRPHRDNTSPGTAHRRFAVTINLNAEDYEGGDLHFPEFGPGTYRAPTGGAVVFSCSLLHEATPVTAGRRYAFLPFLYDEAGEKTRQANLHEASLRGQS